MLCSLLAMCAVDIWSHGEFEINLVRVTLPYTYQQYKHYCNINVIFDVLDHSSLCNIEKQIYAYCVFLW